MPHLIKLSCLAGLAVAASYYSDLCVKQTWELPETTSSEMCCRYQKQWGGQELSDNSTGSNTMPFYGVVMYDMTPEDSYDVLYHGISRYRCVFDANPYVCAARTLLAPSPTNIISTLPMVCRGWHRRLATATSRLRPRPATEETAISPTVVEAS